MRLFGVAILLGLVIGLPAVGSAAPLQRITLPGGIARSIVLKGRVVGNQDGPRVTLVNAAIELRDPTKDVVHQTVASVQTDALGAYRFTNPAADVNGSTPTTLDVPAGKYELYARYRMNLVLAGTVSINPTTTTLRDINMGAIVRRGGAAPPPPAVTFFVTDRELVPGSANILNMFMNKRINTPCSPEPNCMMHYGAAVPTGPLLQSDKRGNRS